MELKLKAKGERITIGLLTPGVVFRAGQDDPDAWMKVTKLADVKQSGPVVVNLRTGASAIADEHREVQPINGYFQET